MNWTVRLSGNGCNTVVHRSIDAPNYSNAVQAAEKEFGANHVIHLVYEGKRTRVANAGE